MAKLNFSLVSPERELYSGEVDQVDIPGTEGDLGIFPDHSPLMAAIRTGTIKVYNGSDVTEYFIQGGFADVTPEGLTVLAEKAMTFDAVERDVLEQEKSALESQLPDLEGEAALLVQQNLDGLNAFLTKI